MRTSSLQSLLFVALISGCNCQPPQRPDAGDEDASVEFDAGIDAGI
jgi:hypothetical protein